LRRTLACALLFSALLSSSPQRHVFTRQEKAFFADPNVVNFVRPGLVLKITAATIATDGTISIAYTISDPQGLALDIAGVTTPGAVTLNFVASYIPAGGSDYIPITQRAATGPVSGTVRQPGTDAGGARTQTGEGAYTYTFSTKAPADLGANDTVGIGLYATRNLTEFDLGTNAANAVVNFTRSGAAPSGVHDVVHTQTCNKCHDPLQAHGGARREVTLCVLCHNPGGNGATTVDPDTGNSIDLKQMVHAIHMGRDLPVKPYQIIGFNNAVNDFSDVDFPAGASNCQMCHEVGAPPQGRTAPPGSMTAFSASNPAPVQGNWWLTHPTRAACGACHNDINWATGAHHAGGPQISDNQCAACHVPQGELPFDASIIGAHVIPQLANDLPGLVFGVTNVANGIAGQTPTITFTLKDASGAPLAPSNLGALTFVLAGPTTDYQQFISESALAATGSNGTYTYMFRTPVPENAVGSWSLGIEGYRNITILPGTVTEQTARDVGDNVVFDFSVDGSAPVHHAVETTTANCNQCHYKLLAHGGMRNQVEYCILCHNPNQTDAARRPSSAGPPQSVDFPVMVHRIHQGEQSDPNGQPTPYIVYGFGGTVNDFSDVRFPGDLRDCAKCHTNNSQLLPLPTGRVNVVNPRSWYSPMGPATAACTGCHTSRSTAAHTSLNTSPLFGESCDVCHGTGADFAVDKVHARTL
jgi:OmcA/MtrC family decaheme c-type cytochrome